MIVLDAAGSVLPSGLAFLHPGWWVLHVLAVAFIYVYGFRKGRDAERREQRARELEGRTKPGE